PSSSETCLRLESAAYRRNSRPTSPEPVKVMASTSGCRPRAAPAVGPKPGTTLRMPSGRPASVASRATRRAVSGDCSAGLRTTALPTARAGAIFHIAIISGKFHGTHHTQRLARDRGERAGRGGRHLVVQLVGG